MPLLDIGAENFFYFIYLTLMDYIYGESIGKMVISLTIQHITGRRMDLTQATIESFSKAFLLPIDLIISWMLYPKTNQRLFNYLSETVVMKDKSK
jgi:uncharacterized RDD family membrane protein YckC